jgi:hypothetical protein
MIPYLHITNEANSHFSVASYTSSPMFVVGLCHDFSARHDAGIRAPAKSKSAQLFQLQREHRRRARRFLTGWRLSMRSL